VQSRDPLRALPAHPSKCPARVWYSAHRIDPAAKSAMIGPRLLATAIVACGLAAGAAFAQPSAAIRGVWTGAVAERSSIWPAGDGRIEVRVDGSDSRFSVSVAHSREPLLATELAAGKRSGVFEPPAAGGIMAFFRRDGTVNPLEGKPLAWARRAGAALIVYMLDVRGGPYRLDRVVLTPAGERLELAFERREHDRPPAQFRATLERQR
jgi:hypothetical protein